MMECSEQSFQGMLNMQRCAINISAKMNQNFFGLRKLKSKANNRTSIYEIY